MDIIKGGASTWATTKRLYGKWVSGWWDGNANFIITNSNRWGILNFLEKWE